MRITLPAPAKVNLWLRVGAPDSSGYHDLSTLFCALDLADTVVLRSSGTAGEEPLEARFAPPLERLPDLGPPESNLAVVAARAFLERTGGSELPEIRLIKRIPAGGGLGGGSSDAAAVLRAMRRLHPDAVTGEDLLEIAAGVGSDVPFFVLGTPLAHGSGRGDRLGALPSLPPRPVVLVLPSFGVPTGDAYRWLDEERERAGGAPPLPAPPTGSGDESLTWGDVADLAVNDFEGPVFARHPELAHLRDALREKGGDPVLLSGSGSTVFGVFSDTAAARSAARTIRTVHPDHQVLVTRTRAR